jgi:hypothetical protein
MNDFSGGAVVAVDIVGFSLKAEFLFHPRQILQEMLRAFPFGVRDRLDETPAGARLQAIYLAEYLMGRCLQTEWALFYFLL